MISNMYINTPTEITNTPNNIIAGYNTWTVVPQKNNWYQKVPVYYIDHLGNVRKWDKWTPPPLKHIPGGMYKGTPTRTGAYYVQNTTFA